VPELPALPAAPEPSSPRESIYAVDVTTLRRRLLAQNVVGGYPEALSPDGKTVAYTPATKGAYGVYLVGIDGGSPRRLIDGRSATWSPDGKRLVVESDSNNDLLTVGANGKGAVQVRFSPARFTLVQSIAWGPTGKSLLVDVLGAAPFEDDIETVGLTGHVQHRFTSKALAFTSAWSPRGTQVAFAERQGAEESVVVARSDGGGRHSVYAGTGDLSIGWSPDGRSVVTANGSQVRVVQADGTGARVVANAAAGGSLSDPAWRPGS
jgi:TolB protein